MGKIIGGEFSVLEETLNKKNQNNKKEFLFSSGRCALFAILKEIEYIIGKKGGGYCSRTICVNQ